MYTNRHNCKLIKTVDKIPLLENAVSSKLEGFAEICWIQHFCWEGVSGPGWERERAHGHFHTIAISLVFRASTYPIVIRLSHLPPSALC